MVEFDIDVNVVAERADVGRALEQGNLLTDLAGHPEVVVVEKRDEFAARAQDAGVTGAAGTL